MLFNMPYNVLQLQNRCYSLKLVIIFKVNDWAWDDLLSKAQSLQCFVGAVTVRLKPNTSFTHKISWNLTSSSHEWCVFRLNNQYTSLNDGQSAPSPWVLISKVNAVLSTRVFVVHVRTVLIRPNRNFNATNLDIRIEWASSARMLSSDPIVSMSTRDKSQP